MRPLSRNLNEWYLQFYEETFEQEIPEFEFQFLISGNVERDIADFIIEESGLINLETSCRLIVNPLLMACLEYYYPERPELPNSVKVSHED